MPPDARRAADGPEALAPVLAVSRETLERLSIFVALLRKWQPAENLVAPSTLGTIWRRHIADSAQLVPLFPDAKIWVDIGTGAGFPGLVVACILAERPGVTVHLVESNVRKCAFLRRAIAETGAPAIVHHGRIEDNLVGLRGAGADVVTARAVASLINLCGLTAPLLGRGASGAFLKGRDFQREIDEATQSWAFDLVIHKSRIEDGGVILDIRRLAAKSLAAGQGP
jgi:16S rRNA (guanine527-N7)-methyltransferase